MNQLPSESTVLPVLHNNLFRHCIYQLSQLFTISNSICLLMKFKMMTTPHCFQDQTALHIIVASADVFHIPPFLRHNPGCPNSLSNLNARYMHRAILEYLNMNCTFCTTWPHHVLTAGKILFYWTIYYITFHPEKATCEYLFMNVPFNIYQVRVTVTDMQRWFYYVQMEAFFLTCL